MIRSLIVAASEDDVIGRDGDLPWHIPGDLRYFKEVTHGHVVVLGRLTHESIIARLGRPLPGRTSVVVSTLVRPGSEDVHWQPSVTSALATAEALERAAGGDEVFVIGGATVYRQALTTVERIYLTRVHAHVEGNSRMPSGWLEGFERKSCVDLAGSDVAPAHSFLRLERVSP